MNTDNPHAPQCGRDVLLHELYLEFARYRCTVCYQGTNCYTRECLACAIC